VLKSFSVKNFRNLNIDKLEFKTINILVGPNNSGKSNLINAISFFSDLILGDRSTSQSLFLAQMSRHGWDDLLNKKIDKPGKVDMKWTLNTDDTFSDLSYRLQFQVGLPDQVPKGFFITNEQLSYAKPAEGQEEPFNFFHCHE
jgi:predicted ATPase